MKKVDLLSATALALFAAMPAYAQTAPQAEAATEEESGNEIIVTASKRAQTLQDVPISVSVTDSKTVEQASINDLFDLQSVVPSLKVPQFQNSSQTNFIIRGFGNGANNIGIESSVGVFIDGVYRSRSASAIADLPEIERIEVLRGPQSTLFGKNVSAGAISIITKKPEFKWGAKVSATYGNYDDMEGTLALNAGLSETVALRLSGTINNRDGYFTNTNIGGKVNDRDRSSVRLDLLFEPSSDVSIRLIGDYNHINEVCCGAVPIFNGPATLFIGAAPPAGLGAAIGNTSRIFQYELAYDQNPNNRLTGKGISLQGDFGLGFAKLTTITALRKQSSSETLDVDFTGAPIVYSNDSTNIRTFSQEVRLASEGTGPFNWLLGAFYSSEKIGTDGDLLWGPRGRAYVNFLASGLITLVEALQRASGNTSIVPGSTYIANGTGYTSAFGLNTRSYSLFGQTDYELTDKLTVSGGIAYLNDRKRANSVTSSTDAFAQLNLRNLTFGAVPIAGLPNVPISATQTLQGLALLLAGPGATLASPIPGNLFSVLGLGGLQFLKPIVDFPNATESGVLKGNKVVYMGRIAYDFSNRLNAYASYSKGWKAGAYNLSRDSRPPDVAGVGRTAGPEDVTVYEVGIKGSFTGGFVNVAVFKQSIKGFQSNAFTGTGFNLVNAGEQSVKGFELDASYRPARGLVLGFSATYLDPLYNSFLRATCVSFDTANCGAGQQFRDLSGTRPAGISKWSTNLNAAYNADLGGDWKGFIRGEYIHASKTPLTSTVPATIASIAVNTINASIGFGNEDIVEVMLWARNLNKDTYLQGAFASVAQSGSYAGYPNLPRTYGITLRKSF
jgi:iron complex outermembrane receptor protein